MPGPLTQVWLGPIDEEAATVPAADRRVFIVYGHYIAARDNLELVVRRMKLEPIVLQSLPAQVDTIIEKLDRQQRYLDDHGNVGFACVLLTPDDQGHAAGKTEEIKYRARQNVILELWMVLGRLGRAASSFSTKVLWNCLATSRGLSIVRSRKGWRRRAHNLSRT